MINYFIKKNRLAPRSSNRSVVGGFTLVETLVAISILMVSIAGPMVLVGNGIKASAYARDQVTAFYLAQDAIEAMRYIRDNNRIDNVLNQTAGTISWDEIAQYGLTCGLGSPCGIDTVDIYNGVSNAISTSKANSFLILNSNGKYSYSGVGTTTTFRRWITVEGVSGTGVEITVTVDWSSHSINRSFSIKENLFYWY
jgi:type II secretory pathway pseudopilin PulG